MPEARRRGQTGVVLRPAYPAHTQFADGWLPCTRDPGGALAMGMGHVLLSEFFRDRHVPYFTGYVQLYVIARMLVNAPHWQFLAEPCVAFRADNDSFRALGQFGRLKMDVCGYETIVGDVFGRDSRLYHEAMAEIARTHARHHIVTAKRANAPLSFVRQALALCVRHYGRYPGFWLHTFPVLIMPRPIMLFARRCYQKRRR